MRHTTYRIASGCSSKPCTPYEKASIFKSEKTEAGMRRLLVCTKCKLFTSLRQRGKSTKR